MTDPMSYRNASQRAVSSTIRRPARPWPAIVEAWLGIAAFLCGGCREPSGREIFADALREVTDGDSVDIMLRKHEDISDDDLARLDGIKALERFTLEDARIGDRGAAHLGKLTSLRELSLSKTNITDEGIAQLAGLVYLESLKIERVPVSDACLATLAKLPKLKSLSLRLDHITDAGLRQIGEMTQLRKLRLDETQVTDAGLKHLYGLTNLSELLVRKTAVTDLGIGWCPNSCVAGKAPRGKRLTAARESARELGSVLAKAAHSRPQIDPVFKSVESRVRQEREWAVGDAEEHLTPLREVGEG